jgi:hypothetical protein
MMLAAAPRDGYPSRQYRATRNLPASHATIFAVVDLADMADRVAAIVSNKPCGATPARLFALRRGRRSASRA